MISKTPVAPLSVWRPINLKAFLLGVPHYPEHVDESYWERDAERMAAAGFNSVRMGEFAWHIFEPREDAFDFDLFDRAIAVLDRYGIQTIMCTPTATPPRWLTANYPEVLRVDGNGRAASHGSRQHADTTSRVYRQHSRRITQAMAEHYKDNHAVIGWQTDNELNTTASRSYSAGTRREFQLFLESQYPSIDQLNFAWGGNFWATRYDSFDQIVLPLDYAPTFVSPGHAQDYHRFLAAATARFQHDQVVILRQTNPDWFIFHNLGGLEDIDFRGQFSSDLDFLGFDTYPMLADEFQRSGDVGHAQAFNLDICRASTGNFIVPEQQSGFGSQPGFVTMAPEPGELRRMAWSSVARGADGLMFFRWRPAHFGAEIYWMGLIDHDDVPRRRYAEARQFATEVKGLATVILGTSVHMDVAIAGADFDNQEAHRTYPMGLPSPQEEALLLHRYCYERGISCGFIHPEDDLSRLKVLYVPHWLIWKDDWTARIQAFAEAGGTVVLSARTGSRDTNNHVIRDAAPGRSLSRLAGVTVEEFGRLGAPDGDGLLAANSPFRGATGAAESTKRQYSIKLGNQEMPAAYMYEVLELAERTESIATWSNRFLNGLSAITTRSVGKGRVVYLGTYLTTELVESFFASVFQAAGVSPILQDLPDGVEAIIRGGPDARLLFVLNTRHESCRVSGLPEGAVEVTDGVVEGGGVVLPGYGCLILRLSE